MAKVKRIGVFSFAIFQAVTMAMVGLVAGILYSFGGLIVDALVSTGWVSSASASTPGLGFGTVLAFGALIGMPAILAALGFVLGLFEAVIYPWFARWFGGIDLDLEQ